MRRPRFYHAPTPEAPAWEPGQRLALSPPEAHHARTVLRLRPGAPIELFDGCGRVAQARVETVDTRGVDAVLESLAAQPSPAPVLGVAYPPPKGKRALAAVEALTELGVDTIIPLASARSVARGGDLERWRARAVEAAKQCRRATLPEITPPTPLDELLPTLGRWACTALCSLAPTAKDLQTFAATVQGKDSILWCIGPEGGFTAAEEEALVDAGALRVCLSPYTLRIATAAMLCTGWTRGLRPPTPA